MQPPPRQDAVEHQRFGARHGSRLQWPNLAGDLCMDVSENGGTQQP